MPEIVRCACMQQGGGGVRENWKGWEHSHRELGGANLRGPCAASREVLVLQRGVLDPPPGSLQPMAAKSTQDT